MAAIIHVCQFVVIFFLLSFSLSVEGAHEHVHVQNDVSPNTLLKVHCKSADDDLGAQFIKYQQSYSWKFRDNLWMTTLFWCNLSWRDSDKHIRQGSGVFFEANRDSFRCHQHCYYSARRDGIYFMHGQTWELAIDWSRKIR
ncbi:hypothetical protein ACHQM5_022112 [Ranunculus cassubicifolius]